MEGNGQVPVFFPESLLHLSESDREGGVNSSLSFGSLHFSHRVCGVETLAGQEGREYGNNSQKGIFLLR